MATIWKGTLTVGLVSVPVELRRAVRQQEHLTFRLLHADDLAPIRYEHVCSADGRVVPWSDIVKGYEYRRGSYAVLTNEDFRAAALSASSTIEIRDFVAADDVDARYFETPYILVPGKGGTMAYAVMREAIRRTRTIGLGTIILHQREHVVGLTTAGDALLLELMRFADELVPPADYDLPSSREVHAPELAMARQLIESLTGAFHPERYTDQYRANLMKIIRARSKGRHAKLAEPERARGDAKVIDLMERLQQSLAQKKGASRRGTTAAHRARSSRSRRRSA